MRFAADVCRDAFESQNMSDAADLVDYMSGMSRPHGTKDGEYNVRAHAVVIRCDLKSLVETDDVGVVCDDAAFVVHSRRK